MCWCHGFTDEQCCGSTESNPPLLLLAPFRSPWVLPLLQLLSNSLPLAQFTESSRLGQATPCPSRFSKLLFSSRSFWVGAYLAEVWWIPELLDVFFSSGLRSPELSLGFLWQLGVAFSAVYWVQVVDLLLSIFYNNSKCSPKFTILSLSAGKQEPHLLLFMQMVPIETQVGP